MKHREHTKELSFSLNFGPFTLIQRHKLNIFVRVCLCLQLVMNQIVNDKKIYKLLCMKIRLQPGFEPSTVGVQKKLYPHRIVASDACTSLRVEHGYE